MMQTVSPYQDAAFLKSVRIVPDITPAKEWSRPATFLMLALFIAGFWAVVIAVGVEMLS